MKLVFATLMLLSILLSSSFVQYTTASPDAIAPTPASPPTSFTLPSYCNVKCGVRCSSARVKRCMRFCLICCQKCQCVPSGYYGNKQECPCYANMVNSKGTSKFP